MNNAELEKLIRELVEKTTVSVSSITISEDKSNNTWFSVEVSEPHFFIGREGEGLLALNHLVRKIMEVKPPKESNDISRGASMGVLVDVNGFQKKRVESIHAIAHMMAERARYFKSNIEIEPMPA